MVCCKKVYLRPPKSVTHWTVFEEVSMESYRNSYTHLAKLQYVQNENTDLKSEWHYNIRMLSKLSLQLKIRFLVDFYC